MLIGEVATITGVEGQTIRFYERQGLLPAPRREPNGYRSYDNATIGRLQFIRAAQTAGLTLAEIGSTLGLRDAGEAPCAHVSLLLEQKLADVRARQRELAALATELQGSSKPVTTSTQPTAPTQTSAISSQIRKGPDTACNTAWFSP